MDLSRNVQSKVDPKSDIFVMNAHLFRFYGVERSGTEEKRGGTQSNRQLRRRLAG